MKTIEAMNHLYPQAIRLFEEKEAHLYDESSFSIREDAPAIELQTMAEQVANSYLLKKRERMYYVTALHVTQGGVTRRLAPKTFNRSFYYVPIEKASTATATNGCKRGIDRYCDVYLYVTVDEPELADILKNPIYRKGDGFYQKGEGAVSFRNVIDNVEAKAEEVLDANGVLKFLDPEKSGYENLTAGQSKSFTVPLVAVNHPKYNARLVKYILTYGASEALQGDEEISMKDLAQGNNRLSQNEAPNTPTGYVGVTAYFMGKYLDAEGNDYRDGFGFVRAGKVARLFSFLTDGKYRFTERAVDGILLQCRPHLCKLMAETVSGEYMSRFINLRHRREDIVCLVRSEVTDEDQAAFIEAVKSKGRNGRFAGKLVLLGDTREELEAAVARIFGDETEHEGYVDFLTDLNGLKAPFDLRFKTTLNILSISHETHDVERGANLSTQLFQSMMYADWKKACGILVDSFKEYVGRKKEAIESEEGADASIEDFDNPQFSRILVSMCPRVATRWYFPILKQVGDALLKGLVNRAGRLRVPTEGIYAKVTTDPAMDFGINILKVLDGGICEAIAPCCLDAGYSEGIAVKYPKQHFREFAKLRFISKDEYAERVAARTDLSEEDKELLVSKVDRTSGGQAILPCYEILKNMLAGMDFDGDAVIIYLDRKIYELMKNVSPLAVVIKEDPEEGAATEEVAPAEEEWDEATSIGA